MNETTRIELVSMDDGLAVLQIAYSGRYARLELDRVEAAPNGPALPDRVQAELDGLLGALQVWRKDPDRTIVLDPRLGVTG
jgi:hypothetical protein